MKKTISLALVLLGFFLGATALSALAQTWTAPGSGCTPPNCNTPTPLNVSVTSQDKLGPLRINTSTVSPIAEIALTLFGKLKIVDGSQGAGKVLTSDAEGKATWQTSNESSMYSSLASKSIVSYGEGVANPVGDGMVKVVGNNFLVPGVKYGYIILTGGNMSTTRKFVTSSIGQDNGKRITVNCGDLGGFGEKVLFSELGSLSSLLRFSYQGTIVYSPTTKNGGNVLTSWGVLPKNYFTNGTTYSGQDVINVQTNDNGVICTSGRGYYSIFIFDYNELKTIMDTLYAATGNSKYKFNDPLSSDPSLWNGNVWTN